MHAVGSSLDGGVASSSGALKENSGGKGGKTGEGSHLTAVAVCVAGAVMSSMLQFSFVYGKWADLFGCLTLT